jgi:hypothetical protein
MTRGQAMREAEAHEKTALQIGRMLSETGPTRALSLLKLAAGHVLKAEALRRAAAGGGQ